MKHAAIRQSGVWCARLAFYNSNDVINMARGALKKAIWREKHSIVLFIATACETRTLSSKCAGQRVFFRSPPLPPSFYSRLLTPPLTPLQITKSLVFLGSHMFSECFCLSSGFKKKSSAYVHKTTNLQTKERSAQLD